jgi:hypothetical protein
MMIIWSTNKEESLEVEEALYNILADILLEMEEEDEHSIS